MTTRSWMKAALLAAAAATSTLSACHSADPGYTPLDAAPKEAGPTDGSTDGGTSKDGAGTGDAGGSDADAITDAASNTGG